VGDVTVEHRGFVAIVTFCRPPVNATDEASWADIASTFNQLAEDKDVRAVVLTACGDRAFMAGQDLRSDPWSREGKLPSAIVDPGRPVRDAMWAVYDCPVPVVAAVNGPAIGGGLAMVALCDIIIASEHATFGATEINVGLLGASAQLSRLVGTHRAREMFFLGEIVPAAELHRLGGVREVVPAATLMEAAMAVATTLADKSPIALRLAKESMNRIEGMPMKEGYRLEQDYTNRLRGYEDSREARRAFLEKRRPDWGWR